MVITISHAGYIKRQEISAYRSQRRGGKGVIGARTKEEDYIEHLFIANTHAYLLFLTDKGRCYWLKVHEIEQAGRMARGRPLVNHLEGLARDVPAARWVRPGGLHLTFKFLGQTPRWRIPEIASALFSTASRMVPLRLVTGATGVFGSERRPRVLWLALEGEIEASLTLAAVIEAALGPLGFPNEDRPFRPHLTLARFDREREGSLPNETRQKLERALGGCPFAVDGIVLFESHLGRGGARYEALHTFALTGGAGIESPAGGGDGGRGA